jgi:uncharacterized protein
MQLLAVGLQPRLPAQVVYPLAYAGSLMVLVAALVFIFARHDYPFQRDFWLRLVDFRRISWKWLMVIFLLEPLVTLAAALADRWLGGFGLRPEALAVVAAQPVRLLPLLAWWLLFGPLVEEPGWRGYALDGLQARRSAAAASAVLGTSWAAWHIPLTFLPGTWQAAHYPFGSGWFWLYMLSLFSGAFLYTWVYNNTQHSILAAILFHFVTNAFGELFELSQRADIFKVSIFIVLVIGVFLYWGPQTMAGREKTHPPASGGKQ